MRSSSGPGIVLEHVGGGEEQHVGQVEVDLEVVVAERVVLRRVEHLEQGRRRVAPPVGADLVDLVEQDDRVHGPGLLQGPDDAAGLGADVGAAVATDLGLVAHAAEGDADELAAEGAGDRLAERRLADAGRADEGEDGAGRGDRRRRPRSSSRPRSARSLRTARYSTMRSFTSSRPVWSASRTSRAASRSRWSSVRSPHGSSSTVSSQVRIQPCSGLCSLVRSAGRSRARWPCARRRAAPGLGQLGRARGTPSTTSSSPSSPSSLRMAASCWRSRNSRWRLLHALGHVVADLARPARARPAPP